MKFHKNSIANNFKSNDLLNNKQIIFLTITFVAFGFLCFSNEIIAQEKPDDLVPPPLNIISKDEKKQLKAETKVKNRTKLALELMESRLAVSEQLAEKNDFRKSLDELGGFQALLRKTLNDLQNTGGQKPSYKNLKRFEISLREFLPRLELVRREMPLEYSYHVRQMIKFVRNARGKAIEPLYGNTVLSEEGR